MIENDVIILGGGLTGLSAGLVLGKKAIIIEGNETAGGLVKTDCFNAAK